MYNYPVQEPVRQPQQLSQENFKSGSPMSSPVTLYKTKFAMIFISSKNLGPHISVHQSRTLFQTATSLQPHL